MQTLFAVTTLFLVVSLVGPANASAASSLRLTLSYELGNVATGSLAKPRGKQPLGKNAPRPLTSAVVLENGRLSVQAKDTPLGEILALLERQGVTVRLPEHLRERKVSVRFTGLKQGVGLRRLLRGLSYVATYSKDKPDTHNALQLAEVRIMRSGAAKLPVAQESVATLARNRRIAQN